MTTGLYASDVKVEIAFNAGFSTPAASRVWTDVSEWLELSKTITIGHGRTDERAQADANTLSLTFDNRDGRFTPLLTTGAYYPNVKLYRPIRVTVTPVSSVANIRFTGYINQWQGIWDGTDENAWMQVTAASRMSRLGLQDVRLSTSEETAKSVGTPRAYFTLSEPADSNQAVNTSESTQFPLAVRGSGAPPVFGSAASTPYDSLTGVTFANGGGYLGGSQWNGVIQSTSTAFTLSCFYSRGAGAVTTPGYLMFLRNHAGTHEVSIQAVPSGTILGATTNTIVGYFDDPGTTALQHLALIYDSTASPQMKLYRNGALVQSDNPTYSLTNLHTLSLGGSALAGGNIDGSMSHVAVFPVALTSTQISTINAAGATGFTGLGSGSFLERFAGWADIPSSEILATGLSKTLIAIDSTGQSVVDLMRKVEQSEPGVLYDQRDGKLALVPDSTRYTAASAFALDMELQQVEGDFSPSLDPSAVINTVQSVRADGQYPAYYASASSRDDNGVAAESIETYSTDPTDPEQMATWRVGRYAEPRNRVPNLTVDVGVLSVGTTPTVSSVLNADVGTLVTVSNQPAQAESTTGSYFVEGYTETFGPEPTAHVISFNVSPAEVWTGTVAFNDAARGFNSGAVFAY